MEINMLYALLNKESKVIVSQWYPTHEQIIAEAYSMGIVGRASSDFPGDNVSTSPFLFNHIIVKDTRDAT
jgi:hypothetical protein